MTPRTSMPTLALAMQELALTVESDDGVANAALAEAADRLAQVHRDLALLAPYISQAAGAVSRRTKEGKALRAAADRLVAEVVG